MSWYANQIYTLPNNEVIENLQKDEFLGNRLFHVDNFRGVRFDWTRSFMCNERPSKDLKKLKHGLPQDGLLAIAPEICLSRYYDEMIISQRYREIYESQSNWNTPKEKWSDICSNKAEIFIPKVKNIEDYSLELLRKLKELYLRTGIPSVYYHCSMWGGDIEAEFACVISESETYLEFEEDDYISEHKVDHSIKKEGDVLIEAMSYLGLMLPTRFFALHEGSFDWETYMISKA